MRALVLFAFALGAAAAEVTLLRTPNGGIQPQAAVDEAGRIHLVYFNGAPRGGDLFYVRGQTNEFSQPIRVNSKPGSAIAAGTIRGAQLALGKKGRVHVAWNAADGKAMLYTRLSDAADEFEPQRNVMTWTGGLDGGGSVAADKHANVYVTWHGSAPENKQGESGRAVFVARSRDEGQTFAKEIQANPNPTGACGCCGMKALASGDKLYVLYRAATKVTRRDMTLLVGDEGDFEQRILNKWTLGTCPMSSAALIHGTKGVIAAFETEKQVAFFTGSEFVSPAGSGKRKHPTLAQSSDGTVLLAWTENTGWEKGGSLAWQLFKDKQPIGEMQRAEGVPVWSMPAAIAVRDSFYILY